MTDQTPEPNGKHDPFSTEVQRVGEPEPQESKDPGVKGLNARVLVAGGLVSLFGLLGLIVVMSIRAEEDIQARRQAQLEEKKETVEIDSGRAAIEAERRLKQAKEDKQRAKKAAKADARPKIPGAPPTPPLTSPDVPGAPELPGAPGAPVPGALAGEEKKEKTPWELAREQYRASQAQQHYALMAQARMAPIFTGEGAPKAASPSSPPTSGLPQPKSDEEAAFLARIRQVKSGVPQAPAMVRPGAAIQRGGEQRFSTTTPSAPVGLSCGGSVGMRCVQAGTLVKAVLATAIDSSLPGMIVAQVSHPVWDPTLTRIVIPAGSKILGEYGPGLEPGQTRAEVAWTRLILTSGESVKLDRYPGASMGGASGVTGEVDEHWDRLLSGAALSGMFAASGAALAGPVDGFSVNPARQAITGGARPLQELGEQRAKRELSLGPTLRVGVGTRVGMLVSSDLLLPPGPGAGLHREGVH